MSANALFDLWLYLDGSSYDLLVYSFPSDKIVTPAVVLTPGSPFQTPITQSQGGVATVVWGVEAKLVVSRSQPEYGLTALYNLRKQVTDLLVDYTTATARWLSFDNIETVKIGGEDYLQGTLTLAITAEETAA